MVWQVTLKLPPPESLQSHTILLSSPLSSCEQKPLKFGIKPLVIEKKASDMRVRMRLIGWRHDARVTRSVIAGTVSHSPHCRRHSRYIQIQIQSTAGISDKLGIQIAAIQRHAR